MPFTLTMPKLSPTMEEGTIVSWHTKVGDYVEAEDLLLEVATDKATVEYNAIDAGYLRKVLIQEGEEASVNQAIAIFTEEKDESIEGYEPEGISTAPAEAPTEEEEETPAVKPAPGKGVTLAEPAFVPEPPLENYTFEMPTEALAKRIKASPLARKLAKEEGLDLSTVKGSGPGGRVMQRDLDRAQPQATAAFSRREVPTLPPGTYEEEALTPMQKVVGQRLKEAKSFIPHFYVEKTIDAEAIVAMRKQLKNGGIKVTFNDFVIRAVALALREHPGINSGFNSLNQSLIRFKTIDIAVAVGFEGGLITPIVCHTDYKNLGEISVEVRSLAKRALAGKLEPHEYKGGSFTVSNLGMYGVTDFQSILNPPQAAILAISGIRDVPVVKEGSVVPGKMLNITLSCDHRVIDGVAAAKFLVTVQKYLENPAILIV